MSRMFFDFRSGILIALCFLPAIVFGQNYRISGQITDSASGIPVEYANVYIHGCETGANTDSAGNFLINTPCLGDSIFISVIGYKTLHKPIDTQHFQQLHFFIAASASQLGEVNIVADKDPGAKLMKKVVSHKPDNDIQRLAAYSYRTYRREELDINHVKPKAGGLQLTKAILAKMSSSEPDSSNLQMPLYFVETISDQYHIPVAPNDETHITAQKTLGLETDKVFRQLEKFRFEINVYDNWIPLFYKTFAGPVNDRGTDFYKYYISDSSIQDGRKTYTVQFVPRQHENAFRGNLKIADSSFAIIACTMQLSRDANLNFVQGLRVNQDFHPASFDGHTVYLPAHHDYLVTFQSGLDLAGIPVNSKKAKLNMTLSARKTFDRERFGNDTLKAVLTSVVGQQTLKDQIKDTAFWSSERSDTLTRHERAIYAMADSLNKNPRLRFTTKIAAFLGSGFWDFNNKWRIGPYSSFLSLDPVEGIRFRAGFWTLPGVSEHWNFNGYLAYGTKDHKFKGGIGLKYIRPGASWSKTSVYARSDYDVITDYDDELDRDNIISSILTKNIPSFRSFVQEVRLQHEEEFLKGLTNHTTISYKIFDPVFGFQYEDINNDDPAPTGFRHTLPVAEFNTLFIYAPGQRYTTLNYDRISLYNTHPVFSASYTYGFELANAEFVYHKINAAISQNLKLPPKATLYYRLAAGKTFGVVPYILLNVPKGNEYYVSTKYGFNTMAPYEFISDKYMSLNTRLSLGGLLLDHIPWIQRLQWRERLSFNSFLGGLSAANSAYNTGSNTYATGNIPFAEVGIGIENIFHAVSVEYYRRLTHLDNKYATPHGIFIGVTLNF